MLSSKRTAESQVEYHHQIHSLSPPIPDKMAMEYTKEAKIGSDFIPSHNTDSPHSTVGESSILIDPVLEKRAISKFDKYMMPQMALLMLIAYLDRTNIGV